jgi:hypothetical protein
MSVAGKEPAASNEALQATRKKHGRLSARSFGAKKGTTRLYEIRWDMRNVRPSCRGEADGPYNS